MNKILRQQLERVNWESSIEIFEFASPIFWFWSVCKDVGIVGGDLFADEQNFVQFLCLMQFLDGINLMNICEKFE